MNGFSTMTQKGQVAIPKPIRDFFELKPSDKLYFEVKDNSIVARPVSSIEDMRGIVRTKRKISKKQYKKTIRESVLKKYANRS